MKIVLAFIFVFVITAIACGFFWDLLNGYIPFTRWRWEDVFKRSDQ
jgi:hypothetical protein